MNIINSSKIKKVLLMQPNFTIIGKRSWKMPPYNLAILKACLKDYEVEIYDPNFEQESESEIRQRLRESKPDVVGMTTFSTEYSEEIAMHAKIIRE